MSTRMKVVILQHVPFDGIGSLHPWLEQHAAEVTTIRLYEKPSLPEPGGFDWLIVIGGPMNANDETAHPWLRPEKRCITDAISGGRIVLGICLGAQLIASALGARVFQNPFKEIGWFPIRSAASAGLPSIARHISNGAPVFHWHGDTFDLPPEAIRIAGSEACVNQAFVIGSRVAGLQFHLEITHAGATALIDNCRGDIVPGPYVQSAAEILAAPERFNALNRRMDSLLDFLAGEVP